MTATATSARAGRRTDWAAVGHANGVEIDPDLPVGPISQRTTRSAVHDVRVPCAIPRGWG